MFKDKSCVEIIQECGIFTMGISMGLNIIIIIQIQVFDNGNDSAPEQAKHTFTEFSD